MKKYLVFIISLALLYIIFEFLAGMVLTATYTPDFSSMESNLSQEVVFGNYSLITLLSALLPATIAYFISGKICKTSSN